MKFVKFEDRKAYHIDEMGILCDYEPILIDEERAKTDFEFESVQIKDSYYMDPHHLEDSYKYYEDDANDGLTWWESRFYYDLNRVVVLDTVDTSVYMFDTEHSNLVYRRPV